MRITCEDCTEPPHGKYARLCAQHQAMRRASNKPSVYIGSPAMDDLIKKSWQDGLLHGKAAALYVQERMAKPWPIWQICNRARNLGLAKQRKKEPPWSAAELELLETYAWLGPDRLRLKFVAAGFSRTVTAILIKRKRLKLLNNLDGYHAASLGELFGCCPVKVSRWINRGWLKGEHRANSGEQHDKWWIEHDAVKPFVLTHLEEVDLSKVDKLWFVSMLTGKEFDELAVAPVKVKKIRESDLHLDNGSGGQRFIREAMA